MGSCASMKQKKIDGNIQIASYKVCITAFIWNKESHNLFDFESHQASRKDLELDFSGNFVGYHLATLSMVDNQIIALSENEYVKKQVQLLRVDCEQDYVTLSGMSQKSDSRVWAILCRRPEFESLNEWELQRGDIIKLGRMKLQLLDFNYDLDALQQQRDQTDINDEEIQSQDLDPDGCQCRICFQKNATVSNPLFSPCKCIGSMKYVHLHCLQVWIQQSIKVKNQQSSTQYIWKKMECEICKMPLKSTYTYQRQIFCIMQIQKPTVPYMIWKITSDDKSKGGHHLEEIKIGRIPDCDIKLKDISVSRSHALIKVIKQEDNHYKLILQDNNSKFGTLLYAQSDKLLRYNLPSLQKVLYQIGRVLLYIQFKDKGKSYNKQQFQFNKPRFTCYKHPDKIVVQTKINQNEQATIIPNVEKDKDNQMSFQTYNELHQEDIVINVKQI
ncbi:unnamed protein product (macronuclear) [Paramecium tetraurelia]|uniref:FHA domain-containing protein n=1 Tax=Paramecium tetraurelia TaxID=5888 RepID=A0D481_PARTE|nr:uncharacterized protein GSPATT00013314001 [Paramecium tetraurelia]CAK77848.1 unnamed protein product [Paramecium tetraurelia]|eukprot:XP_001445245.1 hypothetical protein (macronuclear) [Paramecium tetraurelia strain d4-2]